jgi:hypothetical protein
MPRAVVPRKAHPALRALAAILCLAAAACVTPGGIQQGSLKPASARGDGDIPDTGGSRVRELPVARKPVSGKEAPATLFAVDGTRCTVTNKKFEETREGDRVLCAWRKG